MEKLGLKGKLLMARKRFYSTKHLIQMEQLDDLLMFIEQCRTEIAICVEPSLTSAHTAKGAKRWTDPLYEALDELEAEAFNIDERVRGGIFG